MTDAGLRTTTKFHRKGHAELDNVIARILLDMEDLDLTVTPLEGSPCAI
jgi:hypothetical protein